MARSFKKTPYVSFANSDSEKKDKQKYNRSLRRQVKSKLNIYDLDQESEYDFELPNLKEVSNPLCMSKE